jgi:hypothetical protein
LLAATTTGCTPAVLLLDSAFPALVLSIAAEVLVEDKAVDI